MGSFFFLGGGGCVFFFFVGFSLVFPMKTAVSLCFGRIWRDFPWFSYEKTWFLLFLGFSWGKQQFPYVLDGFGVIFLGFPTKKHVFS